MVKKEKIFELKIEEDDDLSGVDSISLVDEPAIEVNWMFFNKTQEDFHIPDGEDEKYLSLIIEKGQPEQELLNEGWKVESIRLVGESQFFDTNPNAESAQDTEEYLIRYKYILNPNISQSAIIPTTRQFCRTILNQNRVWRIEDMDMTFNEFGQPATLWRGGFNCRHRWAEIKYKRDTTITNKASVKRGIVEESVPPQPSTITNKTRNNPSPSTVKNLGLSKEMFADKPKISLDYDGVLSTPDGKELYKELVDAGNDVYIVTARSEAEGDEVKNVAKELRIPQDKVLFTGGKPKSDVLNRIGIIKHYDNNPDVLDEIKKNAPDVEAIKFGYDIGGIGGYVNPGITGKTDNIIPKSLVEPTTFEYLQPQKFESYSDYPDSVKNNAKAVLKYVEENGWGSCGTDVGKQRANQLAKGEPISLDTVKRMYSYLSRHEKDLESSKGYGDGCGKLMYDSWGGKSALSWAKSKINQAEKMSKQYFQIDSEEKRIVLGPAMIPDQKIFRKDANGNPYYVFFSPETIKMIAEKYMKNQYTRNNDLMHDGQAVQDIYVVESWIKESEHDKSNKYGYESLPVGTWFVSMKIPKTKKGDEVWSQVKQGKLNGFSVSGFFEEVQAFTKEEMFLYKVSEILSNIKDYE